MNGQRLLEWLLRDGKKKRKEEEKEKIRVQRGARGGVRPGDTYSETVAVEGGVSAAEKKGGKSNLESQSGRRKRARVFMVREGGNSVRCREKKEKKGKDDRESFKLRVGKKKRGRCNVLSGGPRRNQGRRPKQVTREADW